MRSYGKRSLFAALVASVLWYGCASSDTATVENDPGDSVSSAVGSKIDITVPRDSAISQEISKIDTLQMKGAYRWLASTFALEVPFASGGGAAIAIVENGEVTFKRGFGVKSDDATGGNTFFGFGKKTKDLTVIPDGNTIFGIGGISKTLTAIAVMQLVEKGRISLDGSVLALVPELGVSDPHRWLPSVTVRQLLTHSSGFSKGMHGVLPAVERADDAELEEYWTYLMASPKDISLDSSPGSIFHYSNNGFSLLGLVVERASGMPFASYMRKNVLDPLGMTRTTFVASDLKELQNYASSAINPLVHDTPHARPCSGAYSTVLDLAKLAKFLMAGNQDLLSTSLLAQMESKQTNTHWHLDAIWSGFGLYNNSSTLRWNPQMPYDSDTTLLEVSGQWNQYASHLVMVPSKNFAYVMVNNKNILPAKTPSFALVRIAGVGLTPYFYDGKPAGRVVGNYISESGKTYEVWKSLVGGSLWLSEENNSIDRTATLVCPLIPLDKNLYDCTESVRKSSFLLPQAQRFGWVTFIPDASGKITYLGSNTVVAKRAMNLF